ncbi:hypothetical protein NC661_15300 [Aquibacillus koreensis]|uniref:Squalene cyclase C-terminal domain-containing protein n=1 Tax=Aquibacillus koreensis TaxID=279446 RepID=A0A9X3WN01_9BACI|nr:hypothetical protein [Aquibacillus koreensis]MCT2534431.1 hypothetical protein [Aquibacillus koreensis]MDC3421738.1 hypothetical protein [Aquibacillus koreensis]
MRITEGMFFQSSNWMKRNARPLEIALWEYYFEQGSRDRVVQYLTAFQNEDGGFGHGVEPDFWSPYSSPMATWAAAQILFDVEVDSNQDIVQRMLAYLVDSNDRETGMWPSVLPGNNQFPHAPWWHWSEGVQNNWMFNPGVELAAYLIHWSPEQSEAAAIGWSSIEKAIQRLQRVTEMDWHEIHNYQRLIKVLRGKEETVNHKLAYSLKDITDKVSLLIMSSVERDVTAWSTGYKPLPLDFMDSPEDPLSIEFGSLIEQNLHFYVDSLSNEGTWEIPWDWGSYPEAFTVAKRYWQGIMLVRRFMTFQAFGYLQR